MIEAIVAIVLSVMTIFVARKYDKEIILCGVYDYMAVAYLLYIAKKLPNAIYAYNKPDMSLR